MRLAISNIAWWPEERPAVHAMLARHRVHGLEIAPSLTFPNELDAFAPSDEAVRAFLTDLHRHGLQPVSMQSLLFGVKDARLFGTAAQREAFEHGIGRAVALAGRLGVPNLVMGSPANRVIPEGMTHGEAETMAVEAFRRLGNACVRAGCRLALEPNPVAYSTNFLTTIGETAAFALKIDHPGVSVNFDLGSLHMNGEIGEVEAWFAACGGKVSHVHVSEPQLAPAPEDADQLRDIATALKNAHYCGWYSIEMRQVGSDNLAMIEASLDACVRALAGVEAA